MGAVLNGQLVVMGGFTSGRLEVTRAVHTYDPVADRWSTGADLPGPQTHAGVAVVGSTVWLVGGLVDWPPTTTGAVWHREAASDTWVQAQPLPRPRAAMAVGLVGNQLHAVGGLAEDGQSDSSAHAVLDLSQPSAWTDAPAMPNPRNHLGGAAIDGRLFVVGGRHGWDEAAGNQPDLDVFDPGTSLWSSLAPLPLARSEIAASTFASGGQLIVVGGSVNPAKPSADVFVFDPAANTWLRLPALPGPRKGAVAVRIGRELIVTTGSPTGTDPDGTTWRGCCLAAE